ncbi:riboflavin synthase [bacterium]|nr:riboflavin synthase [bacterium]RQV98681.1 MAG: riboflavin synthase [bacterium]
MFTGIIEEIGRINRIGSVTEGRCFQIKAQKVLEDLLPDHSLAVNGVCLTATKVEKSFFEATAVEETLSRSTLANIKVGQPVNLERALKVGDRLGGHFVQGHVDGVGSILAITTKGKSKIIEIEIPQTLINHVIEKGSVAVDGVSLTIAAIKRNRIQIALIPYTLNHTISQFYRVENPINIEVDFLGKYIERLIKNQSDESKIDETWLHSLGY